MAIFTGALVKGMIGGAVKATASKIGKSKVGKLLGREKRIMRGQPHPKAEVGGIKPQQSFAPDAPDVGVGPTPITPVDGEGEKSFSTDKEAALQIKRSTIEVATLLKGSYVLDKERQGDKRKEEEQEKRGKAEKGLEKPKGGAGKLKIKIPGKGILDKMFGFVGQVLLFGITMKLLEWGPKLMPILKGLAVAADWMIEAGIWIVDALANVIDFGYKLVDKMNGWVKNTFGEEGAEKFQTFMTNLKDLFTGFLLWKIIGKKILTAVIANIKYAFGIVKSVAVNAFRFINFLSGGMIGKGFQALGQGIGKIAGNVAGRFMGTGAGKVAGGLFKHGAKRAGKRVLLKMFGKTFVKTARKIFGRVPIVGPLIVGLVSLVSGEPIGKALFKTFGAALGGFLGTIAGTALTAAAAGVTGGLGVFLGNVLLPGSVMIGEILGTFLGDALYGLIFEGGLGAVGKKFKEAFVAIGQKIGESLEAVKKFFSEGFKRFVDDFPTIDISKIWGLPRALGAVAGLLGLKDSKWVENGKVNKIPNLLLLTPFGLPFMIPHLINSFFPGQKQSVSPPNKGGTGDAEKERKREEREKKRKELIEAAKKKFNQVKEFAGNVLQKANPLNWFKEDPKKKAEREKKRKEMIEGMKKKFGQAKEFAGNVLQKANPLNWFKQDPKKKKNPNQARIDEIKAGPWSMAAVDELHSLGVNDRKINQWARRKRFDIEASNPEPGYIDEYGKFHKTSKGVLKQYHKMQTANKQGGAQGVIDSISTTASYEDSEIEVIPLPAPVVGGGGGGADTQMPEKSKAGGSTMFTAGTGSKGAYNEILYKGS